MFSPVEAGGLHRTSNDSNSPQYLKILLSVCLRIYRCIPLILVSRVWLRVLYRQYSRPHSCIADFNERRTFSLSFFTSFYFSRDISGVASFCGGIKSEKKTEMMELNSSVYYLPSTLAIFSQSAEDRQGKECGSGLHFQPFFYCQCTACFCFSVLY